MVHKRWRWRQAFTQSFGRPKWRARRLSSSGWVTERNERARCLRTRTMRAGGLLFRRARDGMPRHFGGLFVLSRHGIGVAINSNRDRPEIKLAAPLRS